METILIVEDDPAMLTGLKDNFSYQGYKVLTADDGEKGLDVALSAKPDVILLDIMLPKINGYEICRLLRQEGLDMHIIMLTAKGEESDVVLGLNIGADDYVTKPFSINELLARVSAFLRKTNNKDEGEEAEFGDYRIDLAARRLFHGDEEIELSPKEFNLLVYFVEKQGRALTRDDILNAVWGYDCIVTSRSVDRFVTTLRNKIEHDPAHPVFIHTVRQVGYRFDPPQA